MRYKIAALVLSIAMFLLIGMQLVDYTPFALAHPPGTTFDPSAWGGIANALGQWLWSYRAIDVLVQGTLLLAAVFGTSAMFRAMRRDDEEEAR